MQSSTLGPLATTTAKTDVVSVACTVPLGPYHCSGHAGDPAKTYKTEANVNEVEIALTTHLYLSASPCTSPTPQNPSPVDSSWLFLPGIRKNTVEKKPWEPRKKVAKGGVFPAPPPQCSHSPTNHGKGVFPDTLLLRLEAGPASAVAGSLGLAARAWGGVQIAPSPLQGD